MTTPTLADVARATGVSRTTVSNAYNRPDQLSPELRHRVLAAAAELGYTGPDPVARGLRRGRTGMVGLVYDQPLSYMFTDPAIVQVVTGMTSVWDDAGLGLALLRRVQDDDSGAAVVANAAVDGFVSICDVAGHERLDALAGRGLPFVMLDRRVSQGHCHVGIDDRGASRGITQHLLDLGHRRLAVVALPRAPGAAGGPLDTSAVHPGDIRYSVTANRLEGIRDAVVGAGLPWDAVPVIAVSDDRPARGNGRLAGAELLDGTDPPTAVVAMSDELAIGVLQAAADRDVEVPGRLSVVGFDDTPEAPFAAPPLTTVRQPLAGKGEAAARLLLEGAPATDLLLPTELIVRASTGQPPVA